MLQKITFIVKKSKIFEAESHIMLEQPVSLPSTIAKFTESKELRAAPEMFSKCWQDDVLPTP
jgi:hypothetical protein